MKWLANLFAKQENFIFIRLVITNCDNHEGFIAVAIDMDIVGFGATPEKAKQELLGNIEAQISLAVHYKDPSILQNPAEEKYQRIWAERALTVMTPGGANRPSWHASQISLMVPPVHKVHSYAAS